MNNFVKEELFHENVKAFFHIKRTFDSLSSCYFIITNTAISIIKSY